MCSLGAFALAKYQFPGRTLVFWLVIATIMVPFEAIYIPLYFIMLKLNWLDTYQALIVPFAASAFGIFMLRQYMVSVPDEFIDAAKVDGAIRMVDLPERDGAAVLTCARRDRDHPVPGYLEQLFWPVIAANGKDVLTIPVRPYLAY